VAINRKRSRSFYVFGQSVLADPATIECEKCGKSYPWSGQLAGKRVKCTCGHRIPVPARSPLAPEAPKIEQVIPEPKFVPGFPRPAALPLDYEEVRCAYEPSGRVGNLQKLLTVAFFGVGVGIALGLLCGSIAVGINFVHNLLPVRIFLISICAVVVVIAAPLVAGGVGAGIVGGGAEGAKCRNPLLVLFVSFVVALVAVVLLTWLADVILKDGFIDYIERVMGGATNKKWSLKYKPVDLPDGAIYGVLGASGLLGALLGSLGALDAVGSIPFCEPCQDYLEKNTLWSVAPNHADLMIAALAERDLETIRKMPEMLRENRIDIVLWSCAGKEDRLVELFGHAVIPSAEPGKDPKVKPKARIDSRYISPQFALELIEIASKKVRRREPSDDNAE
jgi:hypothetical protein